MCVLCVFYSKEEKESKKEIDKRRGEMGGTIGAEEEEEMEMKSARLLGA